MIDRVVVDFEKTFGTGIFLGVDPKMTREDKADPKSQQVQARDKDGVPKWTATVAVRYKNFENVKTENLTITINNRQKPYEAMPIGQTVAIDGLEMGIMKQDKGGFSIFFSAANIRPLQTGAAQAASQPKSQFEQAHS